MHTMNPDAHGLAAMALMEALTHKLISKGVLKKAEVLDICAELKASYDALGVRHDNSAETDAALLIAALKSKVDERH
ncbi:MAG: hypothetical protein EXR11_13760 [Rhodospirillaceae bacterium]|nr:hypothetical protein [Rhodospirillaceae bacterium]